MFRKLAIGLTALAMLAPGLSSALGVGDYELRSYLNQPLDMRVELFELDDLEPQEIIVNLASEADFRNSGVERVFFLNNLNYEVVLSGDGQGFVQISTTQPVREPFLNFVVEVIWPTGRMLREFTILLDPPSTEEAQPAPVQQPAAVQPVSPAAEQTSSAQPASSVTTAPAPDTRRGPDYVVQSQDTLWRIALNHRPVNSISIQQMLIAIQTLNPDAFIDGNVNLVREGTVLRIPTEAEVRQIGTRQAIAEVAEQNRQWRAKLEARGITLPSRTQLDGGAARDSSSSGADAATEGKVTLVSPGAASGEGAGRGGDGEGGADSAALENELAISDENVDRLGRQNAELESRLKDLQEQVSTSEQLLKLRNDQIAQLQSQLRQLQEAQGIEPTEFTPTEPAAAESDGDADADDGTQAVADGSAETDGEPAQAGDTAAQGAAGEGAAGEGAAGEGAPDTETAVAAEQDSADGQAPAVVTEPVRTAQPVTPVTPTPQPTLMDQLMANIVLIGAGLLAVLALIAGLIFMRRRQAGADEPELEVEQDAELEGDDDFFASVDEFSGDDDAEGAVDTTPGAEEAEKDALEEVDFYTAYGRHAEAASFLRNEIQKAPERDDLKVRMLEVLAEMNDKDGFEREAAAYAGAGASVAAAITALRGQFAGAAEPSLDDLEMDLGGSGESAQEPPSLQPEQDAEQEEELGSSDFDISDDAAGESVEEELSLDLDAADDTLSLDLGGDDAASDDEELSLDLDTADEATGDEEFSLDLDTTDEAGEEDEFSLDLDEGDSTPAAESEELSLDLNDEDDSEEVASLDDDKPASTAGDSSTLSLDDTSVEVESEDFGELSIEGMSDEFSEAAEEPASEDLDLSLDDDDLDPASEEPTQVSAPVVDAPTEASPSIDPDSVSADDDDFDFLGDTDENATKLDLAKAYIDMGDSEGARDILEEVISEGNTDQQQEAKDLLAQVG